MDPLVAKYQDPLPNPPTHPTSGVSALLQIHVHRKKQALLQMPSWELISMLVTAQCLQCCNFVLCCISPQDWVTFGSRQFLPRNGRLVMTDMIIGMVVHVGMCLMQHVSVSDCGHIVVQTHMLVFLQS